MYFKAYLQTQCLFAWHHGKIKRNQPRPQKKSGSSLGAISKHLKVPRSSVQTIVRKYKHHGTTQLSYRSGRRCVLSPRDEHTLVWKVPINPRTTAKDLVKMLEETGTKVYISTVKRVLYWHNLHSRCQTYPRKTDYPTDPRLRRCHLQNSLQHSTQQTGCSLSQCHPFCHQSPIHHPPLWPVCSRRLALATYSSPDPLAQGHL